MPDSKTTDDTPISRHNSLWNDMPLSERTQLMPYMIEIQILLLWQAKQAAIRAHRRHMKEINDLIKNCQRSLRDEENANT